MSLEVNIHCLSKPWLVQFGGWLCCFLESELCNLEYNMYSEGRPASWRNNRWAAAAVRGCNTGNCKQGLRAVTTTACRVFVAAGGGLGVGTDHHQPDGSIFGMAVILGVFWTLSFHWFGWFWARVLGWPQPQPQPHMCVLGLTTTTTTTTHGC